MGRNDFWDRKDINRATHTMIYNRWQLEAGKNLMRKGRDNLYRYWEAQAYVLYERDQVPRVRKVYSKPPRPPPTPSRPPIPVWKPEPITPQEVKAWVPSALTWD